jgi:Ser/Thr protein kinase RdoA (MazF antagonist)
MSKTGDNAAEAARNPVLIWLLQHYFTDPVEIVRSEVLGRGRIHDTYLVHHRNRPPLVVQRLNGSVFPDPVCVAENVALVGEHLVRRCTDRTDDFRVLRTLPARDGSFCVLSSAGEVWRILEYIDALPLTPALMGAPHAFEVGRILGRFHQLLSDFDAAHLCRPLPGFHDLPGYCRDYERALVQFPNRRSGDLLACCTLVKQRLGTASVFAEALARGDLVERVVHGDPKGDNVLFDRQAERAVALVDLDTVSLGVVPYDLGDCLRSLCNPAGERPTGGNRISFDLGLCRRLLTGYHVSGALLTEGERHYLYQGVRLVTFELGLRFLTDYLAGNRYFRVVHPEDNLRRALVQFELLHAIEKQQAAIESLVGEIWR